MIALRNFAAAAGFVAGISLPAMAQQPPLDMRTGLWEIVVDRSSSGLPAMPALPSIPPDVLARMSPPQRAQIEKAMRARGAVQSGKKVTKVCITAESLRQGPDFGMPREDNCTVNRNTRSARGWRFEQTCVQGARKQSLSVRYDLVNRKTVNGTVDIAMHEGGRTMTMKQVVQGRWLNADCGKVKPRD